MFKESFIKEFFSSLEFREENHSYYVEGNKIPISVSGIVERFKKPFEKDLKSKETAIKEGISQQEVLDKWEDIKDRACQLGTETHLFAENYTFNKSLMPITGQQKAVISFFNCLPSHIIPVMVELKMYHKEFNFAGTCDTLFYNTETDKYIITDYKTNKDLFKNFMNEKLLNEFSDLLKNNFNSYQIQLSLYQILFEQTGLKIEDRRIIHLKDDGTFLIYQTEDYTEKLLNYLIKC